MNERMQQDGLHAKSPDRPHEVIEAETAEQFLRRMEDVRLGLVLLGVLDHDVTVHNIISNALCGVAGQTRMMPDEAEAHARQLRTNNGTYVPEIVSDAVENYIKELICKHYGLSTTSDSRRPVVPVIESTQPRTANEEAREKRERMRAQLLKEWSNICKALRVRESNLNSNQRHKGLINQAEMAAKVYLSREAWARYEAGISLPVTNNVGRIATLLGLSPEHNIYSFQQRLEEFRNDHGELV